MQTALRCNKPDLRKFIFLNNDNDNNNDDDDNNNNNNNNNNDNGLFCLLPGCNCF